MPDKRSNAAQRPFGQSGSVDKKVPLGKALRLTDEQLDQLAEVSPEDIEKAKAFWRNNAPPEFADLLDAETVEEG